MSFAKMKLTLLLVIVAAALVQADNTPKDIPAFVQTWNKLQRGPPVPPTKTRAVIETDWIEQKLDHFDESETKTWQMRYMTNDEHFKAGGPIFIYVGGEWSIAAGSISGGHFYDMAQEHDGILYYTEHRYYGQSKPTDAITRDELKYLDVKQALADLAFFITEKRKDPELANSKVIMAGGSYAATMVVWFKRLYPELLDGGWASSAPIEAKVDFREYKEVVGRAMRELGSQECYDRIENGIAELEDMFANKRGAEVKAMLKICNNFNEYNDMDRYSLFGSISNIFAGIVQYQDEGDVPYYCDYLMSFEDDLTAISNFVLWAFGYPSNCIDVSYKDTLDYYMDTTYRYGASRPWYYQTCNEYGWYQSSASRDQPFGTQFPALMYTTMCADIFGPEEFTNENINTKAGQTNIDFGGKEPEVENVYMTHGGLDPWNPMGHGTDEGATVIPRASHCADFGSISSSDSTEMRASKERIAQLVREWLADSTADKARQFLKKLVVH